MSYINFCSRSQSGNNVELVRVYTKSQPWHANPASKMVNMEKKSKVMHVEMKLNLLAVGMEVTWI